VKQAGVDSSDVKPLQIIQPEGPSFRVNGYYVEWQKVDVKLFIDFYLGNQDSWQYH